MSSFFTLPVTVGDPFYDFEVDLDAETFRLELKYIGRDDSWALSIYAADGTLIRAGLKLVSDWVITRLWKTDPRPAGEIITIATAGVVDPATLQELGEEVLLTYLGDS